MVIVVVVVLRSSAWIDRLINALPFTAPLRSLDLFVYLFFYFSLDVYSDEYVVLFYLA
jgi:hypothetical protein